MKEKFNQILEKIKDWEKTATLKDKIIVLIVINILLILIFYWFYYVPKRQEIHALEKQLDLTSLKVKTYKSFVPQYKKLQAKVNERLKFLEVVKKILPKNRNIPEFLKSISESVKKNNLEIMGFFPEPEISKDYYVILPFKISLRGSFLNFLSFLNELTGFSRLVVMHDVDVRLIDNQNVGIVATLYTFQYTGKKLEKKKRKKEKKRRR